mmetsp:Transcript_7694/g.9623  ORF Transcript_7694/g.9623 Transcript_7694/m.9623 type:complete len:221 (-) Transcript_7694:6-668(-)
MVETKNQYLFHIRVCVCVLPVTISTTNVTLLLILGSERRVRFKPYGIDPNKPCGIGRIVIKRLSSTLNIHTRQIRIVQTLLTLPSQHGNVPLIQLHPHVSLHIPLTILDRISYQLHLWREPEPVVAETSEFGRECFGDAFHFAIHADAFDIEVSRAEECSAGCFVDPPGFDTYESILDDIDTTDSVLSRDFVAVQEQVEGVGDGSAIRRIGDLGGHALFE